MSNMQKKPRKKIKGAVYFDYSLLAVLVFLVCFGLVMLYSSSAYGALVKYNDSMHPLVVRENTLKKLLQLSMYLKMKTVRAMISWDGNICRQLLLSL